MTKQPTKAEIQKVLAMIGKDHPERATRANAIKLIETMRTMAGTMLDKIEEDLKSGKVKVNEKGEVIRDGKVIKGSEDSSKS